MGSERPDPKSSRLRPSRFGRWIERLEERNLLATFVVTTVADSAPNGGMTLGDAIRQANVAPGPDTIEFNLPAQESEPIDSVNGGPDRVFVFRPLRELPPLSDTTGGTTIDGLSQSLLTGDTNPNGPEIVLDGGSIDLAVGLSLISDGNRIIDLNIRNFRSDGIQIQGQDNELLGNYIGTSADGAQANGNRSGVVIFGEANRIGGPLAADSNLISGNREDGIILFGSNNRVMNNVIGPAAGGELPLGNARDGISASNFAFGNQIGTVQQGQGNTVAFNGRNGITVAANEEGAAANTIRGNSIHANQALGIDLTESSGEPDGVTPNDSINLDGITIYDEDTGANELQNFPELSRIVASDSAHVEGLVRSHGDSSFIVDFYINDVSDASGFGEGEQYLGTTTVQTDGGGLAIVDFVLDVRLSESQFVTATATDNQGNTSEFSQAIRVTEARSISGSKFHDLSGDGFSEGDPPLSGWSIELWRSETRDRGLAPPGGAGEFVGSTVTDQDGSYVFEGLPPGTYMVREAVDDAWMQTDGGNLGNSFYTIDLSAESEIRSSTGNDFANAQLVTLTGVLWDDDNGDNVIDDDENRLADWTLVVTGGTGQDVITTTDALGRYRVHVPPGAYRVSEILEPGWEQTYPLGRFQTSQPIAAGILAGGVLLADVVQSNGNGETLDLPDLIVLNEVDDPISNSGSLSIFPNSGDGRFSTDGPSEMRVPLGANARPTNVVSADYDDDGDLDLIVAAIGRRRTGEGPVGSVIVVENSQGDFNVLQEFVVGDATSSWNADGPIDLVAADLNNDGTIDLATVDFRSHTVSVHHGDGTGHFELVQIITTTALAPRSVDSADLDRDGDVELIVAYFESSEIVVLAADPSGHYRVDRRIRVMEPTDVVTGDLDGDDLPDLAVAGAEGVSVIWNELQGLAETTTVIPGHRSRSVVLGDVNGDDFADVIATHPDQSEIAITGNLGRRQFGPVVAFPVPATNTLAGISPQTIAVADLDGDQDQDLATGLSVGGASVLLNDQGEYRGDAELGQSVEDLNFGHRFLGTADELEIRALAQELSYRDSITPGPNGASRDPLGSVLAEGASSGLERHAKRLGPKLDMNGDGFVSPIDALLIINSMNGHAAATDRIFDITGDGLVSPLDALLVINRLNEPRAGCLDDIASALDDSVDEVKHFYLRSRCP